MVITASRLLTRVSASARYPFVSKLRVRTKLMHFITFKDKTGYVSPRLLLLLASAVLALNLRAQISPTSPTTIWTALAYPNNNYPDPFSDQQTGGKESDIVGTVADAPFYKLFYDGGTPGNLTDGQLGFRLRLAQQDNPPGFSGAAFVGIDGDVDGALDIFVGVNNQGSGDNIAIWDAGAGLNTSPNTTTIVSPPRYSYAPTASNYNWSAVSLTLDPSATTLDMDAGGKTDYFLTWVVPFADIVTGLVTNGISGFNENTSMLLVSATATQDNNLNQDLNGVAGSLNSSLTWELLGAVTFPYSANGITPVPEPSSVTLALLAIAVIGRRSQRS